MDWLWALILLLGLMCGLMALGLPVAFAFIATNIVGAFVFQGGEAGLMLLVRGIRDSLSSFILLPIPLFILMGEILFHTGVAFKAIESIERLIARLPGRLSVVSIVGGTVFSSLSGSTIANTALLGSVLMPEMLKRGYHPTIAMGPIMATGSIAMLIPPSALAVLLGSLASSMGGSIASAQMSIGKLLIAGIIPGFLMSVLFLAYVIGRCATNPTIAPAYDVPRLSLRERWLPFFIYVVPLFAIFAVVVGSILGGLASPSESAALGCVASLIATIAYRSLTKEGLLKAIRETARISTMILFIIVASVTFSRILNFSGATGGLLGIIGGLGADWVTILVCMLLVLLVLGAFMDQVSMILVTLPFYIPLALTMQIDLLLLGVLMLIVMEISFMTPPFGLLIYVMKGVAPPEIRLKQIYVAAAPFILLALIVLSLVAMIPELATWLPAQIRR